MKYKHSTYYLGAVLTLLITLFVSSCNKTDNNSKSGTGDVLNTKYVFIEDKDDVTVLYDGLGVDLTTGRSFTPNELLKLYLMETVNSRSGFEDITSKEAVLGTLSPFVYKVSGKNCTYEIKYTLINLRLVNMNYKKCNKN